MSRLVYSKNILEFEGRAYDKSDNLFYIEKHVVEYEKNQYSVKNINTKYKKPSDNSEFAQINSSFVFGDYVPESTFYDKRHNIKKILKRNGKEIIIEHRNYKTDKVIKEKKLMYSSNMISGQGFHNFIVEKMFKEEISKEVEIKFLLIDKLDYFTFTVSKVGQSKDKITQFKLNVKSSLLKLFVDEINVFYNDKKQLVRFSGLTNIPTDRGSTLELDIKYIYP